MPEDDKKHDAAEETNQTQQATQQTAKPATQQATPAPPAPPRTKGGHKQEAPPASHEPQAQTGDVAQILEQLEELRASQAKVEDTLHNERLENTLRKHGINEKYLGFAKAQCGKDSACLDKDIEALQKEYPEFFGATKAAVNNTQSGYQDVKKHAETGAIDEYLSKYERKAT